MIALKCIASLAVMGGICVTALKPLVYRGQPTPTCQKPSFFRLFAKPLLILDANGVINGIGGNPWSDKKTIVVDGNTVTYSPTVVDKLNSWSDNGLAEIRWLASPKSKAQTMLAPALGIKYFEDARYTKVIDGKETIYGKVDSGYLAIKDEPDRPLVWIHDNVRSWVSSGMDVIISLKLAHSHCLFRHYRMKD